MWNFIAISVITIVIVWLWKVFSFFWLEPKRAEKLLRKQGFNGNPYRAPFGDTNELTDLYRQANSKPIGLHDNIVPRVIPFIHKTVTKYGKNSFGWIGPRPRVFLSDPEYMREVLTKYKNFQKNFRVTNLAYKLLVGGLVEFEEEKWARHRAKLNPGFHLDKLKEMCPIFEAGSEKIINEWKEQLREGRGVVDIFDSLKHYSASSVANALYGRPYDSDIKKCFFNLLGLAYLAQIAVKTFDIPGKGLLPTSTNNKAKKMEGEVRQVFKEVIVERIKERRGRKEYDPNLVDLFLDELYDEKTAKGVDEETVIEDAIGNFKLFSFAGFETTSNLLAWTIINLAIYPEWQTRAREEVKRVLGGRNKLHPDDLSKLKLCTMILHEVLRLFPPIFELSRIVEEDTQVGDYLIPKGILLQLPIAMLHRNPDIWGEDVDVFNPERFSEGVMKATKGQAAFMPFGWGPRICLGQNFAIMESKVFIATFLNTFTWELSPQYIHAPYANFTVEPQHGAPLMLYQNTT